MSFESELGEQYAKARGRLFGAPPPKAPRPRVYVAPAMIAAADVEREKPENIPRALLWKHIVQQVADKHGVSFTEIRSRRRTPHFVRARQEAMHRLSTETSMSLPEIGRRMGGFDHTTVLYAIRKINSYGEPRCPYYVGAIA